MKSFKPTNWSNLTYRQVQKELANLRADGRDINTTTNPTKHEQSKNK